MVDVSKIISSAQSAGIQAEQQQKANMLQQAGVDTSPDLSMYRSSKLSNQIDVGGAIKGLEVLVDRAQEESINKEYFQGKLLAQSGEALEENPSKWTQRGYEVYKRSKQVTELSQTISNSMDKYANLSPEQFNEVLQEQLNMSIDAEQDDFLKKSIGELYLRKSKDLTKEYSKAHHELMEYNTINAARDDLVSEINDNGGTLTKAVQQKVAAIRQNFTDVQAQGIIGDAAYLSMVANGDIGFYEKLRDNGIFKNVGTQAQVQLANAYKSISKAKEQASVDVQRQADNVAALQQGVAGVKLTPKAINDGFVDIFQGDINAGMSQEDALTNQMKLSIDNNVDNPLLKKIVNASFSNPTKYTDDNKQTIRPAAVRTAKVIDNFKKSVADPDNMVLSKLLSEEDVNRFGFIEDMLPDGISNASDADISNALMMYEDALAGRTIKSAEQVNEEVKNPVTNTRIKGLVDDIITSNSSSWFGNFVRMSPVSKAIQDPIERNVELESKAKALYKGYLMSLGDSKVALRYTKTAMKERTHNLFGTVVDYNPRKYSDGKYVSLGDAVGIGSSATDDDVTAAIARYAFSTSKEAAKMADDEKDRILASKNVNAIRKYMDAIDIKVEPESDSITLYLKTVEPEGLKENIYDVFGMLDYTNVTPVTYSLADIRDYNRKRAENSTAAGVYNELVKLGGKGAKAIENINELVKGALNE